MDSMKSQTNHAGPLPDVLAELLDEREWSLRELWRQIQRTGGRKALSMAGLHAIATGELRPTISSMEKIAAGFNVPPTVFAEYRLAIARRELDPDEVGLKRALATLGE